MLSKIPTPPQKRYAVYALIGVFIAALTGLHYGAAAASLFAFNASLLILAALLALPRCASSID